MADTSDLANWLAELSALSQQYQAIAVPIKAKMKRLEVQLAEETAALTFAMDTLEALIRPFIIESQQTQKVPYVTAVYTKRETWDTALLLRMATEVPAILQAHNEYSSVSFRKTLQ